MARGRIRRLQSPEQVKLVVVTCGGPFNATDGQYADNVVVEASLVGRTA